MSNRKLNIVLKTILNSLLVWVYTTLGFYLAFSQRAPNYAFIVFIAGVGLGYFIGKMKNNVSSEA